MANDFTARVAGISVELGMSVQNKSGIWCKPTVKMDIKIDGGTNPQQREAIIKQAFDEVCDNIEKTISEIRMILYRILRKHRNLSSLRLMLSREPERREKISLSMRILWMLC